MNRKNNIRKGIKRKRKQEKKKKQKQKSVYK
jgi:hypothetical protein